MMRRITKSLLLAFAMVAIASMASARSITVMGAPATYSGPSDTITVQINVDTEGDIVSAVGFHVAFTPGLSLTTMAGVAPPVGIYWAALAGDQTVDAIGYKYVKYDVQDPPAGGGAFSAVLATLTFHVTGGAAGDQVISPVLDPGQDGFTTWDAVNGFYTEFGYTLVSATIVPEPTTAVLLGLGLFGIAYAGRRR